MKAFIPHDLLTVTMITERERSELTQKSGCCKAGNREKLDLSKTLPSYRVALTAPQPLQF